MTNSTKRTRLHRERQREKIKAMERALRNCIAEMDDAAMFARRNNAPGHEIAFLAAANFARQALSQGKTGI